MHHYNKNTVKPASRCVPQSPPQLTPTFECYLRLILDTNLFPEIQKWAEHRFHPPLLQPQVCHVWLNFLINSRFKTVQLDLRSSLFLYPQTETSTSTLDLTLAALSFRSPIQSEGKKNPKKAVINIFLWRNYRNVTSFGLRFPSAALDLWWSGG